jgi:hypothetical protein
MWWRKIIARLFGYRVVWIQYFDGEVQIRLVKPTPYGLTGWVHRSTRLGAITCLENGEVAGVSYVYYWKPVDGQ